MAKPHFLISPLILLGSLTSVLTPNFLYSENQVFKPSFEWVTFEKELNISNQLKKISSELQEGSISVAQAQNSLRYLLEKAFIRPPTYDPTIGHILVTSASLSQLPSAMTLMQKVINPSNRYSVESWQCALQYLSQQPNENACELLIKCLGMPWLSLNLSASFYLSQNNYAKHDPTLISRLQSVQRRLPKELGWIIADTLSRLDLPSGNVWMRQLFSESPPEIQAQILRFMASMNEDFSDLVAKGLAQKDAEVQEAALYCCLLKKQISSDLLQACKQLALSKQSKVAQTAQITLYCHTQSKESLNAIVGYLKENQLHTVSGSILMAEILKDGLPLPIRIELQRLKETDESRLALNASIALLLSYDPSSLEKLSDLLLDDQVLISLQYIGVNSWPSFILEWVPLKSNPIYPFVMATQHRGRKWLLDQMMRLKKTDLTAVFSKMQNTQQEPLQALFIESYTNTYQDAAQEALLTWSNEPGKPWMRLASVFSLWQLNHNPSDLAKLQQWWLQFDWISTEGYISAVPKDISEEKETSDNQWLLDFQTSVYFTVTQELIRTEEAKVWATILEKLSKEPHTLRTLPLLALMVKIRA